MEGSMEEIQKAIRQLHRPSPERTLALSERLTDKEIFELSREQLSKLSAYDHDTIVKRKHAIEGLMTDHERELTYRLDPKYADGFALLDEMKGMTTEEKVAHLRTAPLEAMSHAGQFSKELCREIAEYAKSQGYVYLYDRT